MARPKKTNVLSMFIKAREIAPATVEELEKRYQAAGMVPAEDPDFGYKSFAGLVEIARGGRPIGRFAELCEVNVSSLYRLTNGKNTSPCSDDLIVKMVMNAAVPTPKLFRFFVNAQGYEFLGEGQWEEATKRSRYAATFTMLKRSLYAQKNVEEIPYEVEEALASIRAYLVQDGCVVGADNRPVARLEQYLSRFEPIVSMKTMYDAGDEADTDNRYRMISRCFTLMPSYNTTRANHLFYRMALQMRYLFDHLSYEEYIFGTTMVVCHREVYDSIVSDIESMECEFPPYFSLMLVDFEDNYRVTEYIPPHLINTDPEESQTSSEQDT